MFYKNGKLQISFSDIVFDIIYYFYVSNIRLILIFMIIGYLIIISHYYPVINHIILSDNTIQVRKKTIYLQLMSQLFCQVMFCLNSVKNNFYFL